MTRTPEEVFAHHAQSLGAGDLDGVLADYADDAIFISGRDQARQGRHPGQLRRCSPTCRTRPGI